MQKISSNKKGQFFIASAVIIIFVITAVFFFVAKTGQITNPSLIQRELSFFTSNIKNEFGNVLEISLSNVSKDLTQNPSTFLDSNLSTFSRYAQVQGMERSIIVNVSAARVSASNTSMNATLYLALFSQGSNLESNSWIYRAIDINALSDTLVRQPNCVLNVNAKKEFGEPLTEMNSSNIALLVNGTSCASLSYSEGSPGLYTLTCSSSTCVNSNLSIEVTDHRNIFAHSRIPDTGTG